MIADCRLRRRFGFTESRWIADCLIVAALVFPAIAAASEVQKIDKPEASPDFSWVTRDIKKLPEFKSSKPRYTIWVLGDGKKSAMTMAWDESGGTGKGYDTFYIDTNLNGDLTEMAKCFHGPKFTVPPVKEADGQRTFNMAVVLEGDNFSWMSAFSMGGPGGVGYQIGLMPGNLKIQWSNSMKEAPIYHIGGNALVFTSGKKPGESMGKWTAGSVAEVSTDCNLVGSDAKCLLRFYHSHVPGGEPQIMLRVQDKKGATLEDIAFTGGCGCCGSYNKSLLIPSRVPPGTHSVVVRLDRAAYVGGAAEYVYPVEIENPDFGKPVNDPAFTALKIKCAGSSIVSLRRATAPGQDLKGYPEENVVGAKASDNSLFGPTRDWDMSNANQGAETILCLGQQIHHNVDARTLIKFDLSALPKDTKITGAQLRLTLSNQPFTGCKADAKITAYALKQDWSEEESCWKFAKKGVAWGALGCDDAAKDRSADPAGVVDIGVFPATKDERYRFVAIDLTQLVQKWQSGEMPNYGVILKFSGSGCLKLYSSEFQDYPFRPTLLLSSGGKSLAAAPTSTGDDFEIAKAAAKKANKTLAIKFYSPTCGVCRSVQDTTFADSAVKTTLEKDFQFVNVKIEDYSKLAQDLGVGSVPTVVLLKPDGQTRIGTIDSAQLRDKAQFLAALVKQ